MKTEVYYLGHICSAEGTLPDPEKLAAVQHLAPPSNLHELRSYLGFCSYYRKYVANFAEIAVPFVRLTQKGVKFELDEDCMNAFVTLKEKLTQAPLHRPL